jgi:protein-S-isoprenylcysteine O-methyltransferase Ste14
MKLELGPDVIRLFQVVACTDRGNAHRMCSLELKVPPVPLAVVFAAAMYPLSIMTPAATFLIPGRIGIAIGVALMSIAIALTGVIAFRTHKTTVNPLNPDAASAVVSSGVYRFSRNPMYLGFLLALAAWAVYLSNALAALFLPAFVAYMNRFQIEPEERALLAKFGTVFSQYMAAVRRWI